MTEQLQSLIAALRNELEQYGEMLALLDQQQELVISRSANQILETVTSVNAHASVFQAARQHREECQAELSQLLQLEDGTPFVTILRYLPDEYRVLLQALIEENNRLLTRVRHRARQNQLLLSRSLELVQNLLLTFTTATQTAVYNDRGVVDHSTIQKRKLCDAVV